MKFKANGRVIALAGTVIITGIGIVGALVALSVFDPQTSAELASVAPFSHSILEYIHQVLSAIHEL